MGAGLSGAGFTLCIEFPPFAQGEVGIVENRVAMWRWILAGDRCDRRCDAWLVKYREV